MTTTLYLCVEWGAEGTHITQAQLQPSWETAEFVARQWGISARAFPVIHHYDPESLTNGHMFLLIYGRKFLAKVRLFKTPTQVQLAMQLLRVQHATTLSFMQVFVF